jgi:hypothetical protein
MDRERDIRPVVGVEVRQPRAGEVSERAMAKETPERSAPCVYPESEPPRFEQVSGARAVGTGIAAGRTQDHEAHVSILSHIAVRFDPVLEVGWFIGRLPWLRDRGQGSEPDRETPSVAVSPSTPTPSRSSCEG